MPPKRTRRKAERRNRPRADARLSMRVEKTHEGETGHFVTESQNISASGVYCTSTHYLPPLSKVALTIVLPKLPGGRAAKDLVKYEGIVVRCQPAARRGERHYELACMFSSLEDKQRSLIEEFVAWRNLQSLRAATGATPDGSQSPRRATRSRAAAARAAKPKRVTRKRTIH